MIKNNNMKLLLINIIFFNYFSSTLLANSSAVKLTIMLTQQKIACLDALPIRVRLVNSSSSNKEIYEPRANLTLYAEIKKVDGKIWESLILLDPLNGALTSPEDFPVSINILSKDTIISFVAAAPWKYKGEKVIYSYLEKGLYEIRFSYISKAKSKPIYSNIEQFEVGDFDGYGEEATEYLENLSVPYFIYDIWSYVGNLEPNNFLDARKHLQYIMTNFPKSNYALWANFFLLEAKYYYQMDIIVINNDAFDKYLYDVQNTNNPFFQRKANALLEYIKKKKEKKK